MVDQPAEGLAMAATAATGAEPGALAIASTAVRGVGAETSERHRPQVPLSCPPNGPSDTYDGPCHGEPDDAASGLERQAQFSDEESLVEDVAVDDDAEDGHDAIDEPAEFRALVAQMVDDVGDVGREVAHQYEEDEDFAEISVRVGGPVLPPAEEEQGHGGDEDRGQFGGPGAFGLLVHSGQP